ncbi:enoyl-[acyl-carrier protein] reductase I [Chitinophaga niastensis]|uniref:Enoyl-[acyl-carrier protein] reductase I n=1 Tax=Chitinophaga niastensis TaxID=536980 RepID=A0A2P8HGG4_CHINA|nr:SDR family oxidoreductase [Chitinophaga niastensis]PSL45319.1 enoyl-[acyl-carrier protein] reductase I [Chitinophaga niastensis]
MVKTFEAKNYWALILGGSTGLGLAAAHKLAAHGMNICIVHRNTRVEMDNIQLAFGTIKAHGVQFISFNADVLSKEKRSDVLLQLKTLMGEEGRIRCLLHSIAKGNLKAMTTENGPALETEDFRITIDNMAISVYDWATDILQRQLFATDARILSFTSDGSYKALRHYAAVSAAKAALEAITRSMALEFAPYGVRANCIRAGVTDTASLQKIPGNKTLMEYSKNNNPFQRLTTPSDVANVVYLLCKDEAAWINGAIIPVDGGAHIH